MRTSRPILGLPVSANQQFHSNIPMSRATEVTNTVPNTVLTTSQSSFTNPPSLVHLPNNTPRGTYTLPEADGAPFNPFKGHSLPNEPSGLIETRLPITSPPTKSDPSPSAAFSGAMHGTSRVNSVQEAPQRLTTPVQSPLPSASKVCFH